jgi:hypothetical protein
MEDRVARLERQVRQLSMITCGLVLAVMAALFWGSFPSKLRLSSSVFGTTTLSAGRLEISDSGGEVRMRPDELRFKPSDEVGARLEVGVSPELRLSLNRKAGNGQEDPKKPAGAAEAYLNIRGDPQWGRYQAGLYMTDDLGEWRGAGTRVALATNTHDTPMLELHSHHKGEIVIRFDDKGEPFILLKAPDGRERRIGLDENKKDR